MYSDNILMMNINKHIRQTKNILISCMVKEGEIVCSLI